MYTFIAQAQAHPIAGAPYRKRTLSQAHPIAGAPYRAYINPQYPPIKERTLYLSSNNTIL